jgi:sec-independent protein translocase protein TatB
MFGIDSGELLVIAVVALVVIGPKDLPRVMRVIGQWVGQARGMARHFRSGIDTMIRESELADLEKKWQADNERIMKQHPLAAPDTDWNAPTPALTNDEPAAVDKPTTRRPRPPSAAPARTRPKPPPRRPAGGLPIGAAPSAPAIAHPIVPSPEKGE